jgi:hypothetical protein
MVQFCFSVVPPQLRKSLPSRSRKIAASVSNKVKSLWIVILVQRTLIRIHATKLAINHWLLPVLPGQLLLVSIVGRLDTQRNIAKRNARSRTRLMSMLRLCCYLLSIACLPRMLQLLFHPILLFLILVPPVICVVPWKEYLISILV